MSNDSTIARPYARAVFELAREKSQLAQWSDLLANLSLVVSDERVQGVLADPSIERTKKRELIKSIGDKWLNDSGLRFVDELLRNNRLTVVPAITEGFEALRREAEGRVVASVVSAQTLSSEEQDKLKAALKARLGREITLDCTVDESLISGAVIRAGDYVVDGTVKGRLEKLRSLMTN